MYILYPITMALTGGKYKDEITDLAIMGKAGAALNGSSQYIETSEDDYKGYCLMQGRNIWDRLIEIIGDGGEIANLEVFILAPETILSEVVPEGIRYSGLDVNQNPVTFGTWNDGMGNNPIFNLLNDDVILRTNLGGTTLSYSELAILAAVPGISFLTQTEVSEVVNANSPV